MRSIVRSLTTVAAVLVISMPTATAAQTSTGRTTARPAAGCDLSFDDTPCTTLPCPTTFTAEECPEGQGPGLPGAPPWVCHPYPQLRPPASKQCTRCDSDGCVTWVNSGEGPLPPSNPFDDATFPGTNLLPNVYVDTIDGLGNRIANTLPSTPNVPYNLHDGAPEVHEIDRRSPVDDLDLIIDGLLGRSHITVFELHDADDEPSAPVRRHAEIEALKRQAMRRAIDWALDIIEGEPVPYRAYSGFPLLHYQGPAKGKLVQPIRDGNGDIVGGNVDVHQIWYDQHIEADTAFIDPTPVLGVTGPDGQPITWTVTYTVDVLNRGHDDFSPFVTYTDIPGASPFYDTTTCSAAYATRADCEAAHPSGHCAQKGPMPNVGMDQSFFDMEEGTRTIFTIKMAPAEYLNLVYTWGWRMHPPRIQVMEKAIKKIDYTCNDHTTCPGEYDGCMLPQLEQHVFCNPDDPETEILAHGDSFQPPWYDPSMAPITNTCNIAALPNCGMVSCPPGWPRFDDGGEPTQCERNKRYAIGKIGDLSPAKRMWHGFHDALTALGDGDPDDVRAIVRRQVLPAFLAWQNRTHLPCFDEQPGDDACVDGLVPDPDSDITILYVNNTIYGQLTAGGWVRWPDWETRWSEWAKEDAVWKKEEAAWIEAMAAWEAGPKTTPAPIRPRRPSGPPILDVTAYNSDHFPHSYTIADFGGSRGWENQFKSSVKVAGSGCWFTFGRAYWWMPVGAPNGFLCVDAADTAPTVHKFHVQFNFEPSRRLRFYQFDPMHHDVAIYSIH